MLADNPPKAPKFHVNTDKLYKLCEAPTKRKGTASRGETAPGCSPQNGAKDKREPYTKQGANGAAPLSLAEASALMDETMRRACAAAGTDEAGFRKLPKGEQTAFLAQATGEQRPEVRAAGKTLRMEPASAFRRSPFNRETFDEAKEAELLEQVKAHGVIQPILARPMSLWRQVVSYVRRERTKLHGKEAEVDMTWAGMGIAGIAISQAEYDQAMELLDLQGQVTRLMGIWRPSSIVTGDTDRKTLPGETEWLELVAGERRWRAATKARCLLPVIVEELTDREALEKQAIENMGREDLNGMDEARKFRQLLDEYEAAGMNATGAMEELEGKTGLKRATLYGRLDLLKLPAKVQGDVLAGKLPLSHAGLVVKIKDPEIAAQLVASMLKPEQWQRDQTGVMNFRAARELAERAKQRETDLAEWQRQKAEFEGKGWRVLSKEENKTIIQHGSVANGQPYVKGSDTCRLDDKWRDWEKLWKKKLAPQPILGRYDGKAVTLYDREAATRAVQDSGIYVKKSAGSGGSGGAELAKLRAQEKRKLDQRRATVRALVAKVEGVNTASGKEVQGLW